MPQFRRVKPGQPMRLAADDWNAAMDAAEQYRAAGQGAITPSARSRANPNVVLVKNSSGADRDRFDILGIDAPLIGPSDNEAQFKSRVGLDGVTPAADTHEGRFVVLSEPIADGKTGRATIAGIAVCRVDVADESDGYAEIADGDATQLAAGQGGHTARTGSARILWKAAGTGTQWALVRLGATAPAAGLFCARVVATGTGADYTVREQVPDGPGAFADKPGAEDLTAWNLAELSPGPGGAVDVDTVVLVTDAGDGYYVFDHPVYAKYLD